MINFIAMDFSELRSEVMFLLTLSVLGHPKCYCLPFIKHTITRTNNLYYIFLFYYCIIYSHPNESGWKADHEHKIYTVCNINSAKDSHLQGIVGPQRLENFHHAFYIKFILL